MGSRNSVDSMYVRAAVCASALSGALYGIGLSATSTCEQSKVRIDPFSCNQKSLVSTHDWNVLQEDEANLLSAKQIPSRKAMVQSLRRTTPENPMDILVIGGGATGTGVALDAATRCGLRPVLVTPFHVGTHR